MALYPWLPDELSESAVVVTASRRLARELLNEYGERRRRAGLLAWKTPAISFLGDWLTGILDGCSGSTVAVRVRSSVSARLWELALREELADAPPGSAAIARQCRMTWERLREWQVPLHEVQQEAFGAEQRMFAATARRFSRTLQSRQWLDDSSLMEAACEVIAGDATNMPDRMYFAGFDRVTPSAQTLIDTLGRAGTDVIIAERASPADKCPVSAYQSVDAELRAAGAWARAERLSDPSCRIAIIHPELEQEAGRVGRLVREGFVPGWQYGSDTHRNAVNVSYGRALSEYPAIAVALLALRWVTTRVASRDVGVLLRSPHLLDSVLGGRSRLERYLRQLPDRQWDLAQFLGAARGAIESTATGEWASAWQAILEKRSQLHSAVGAAQWAEVFDDILTCVGWPGPEALSSGEFQLVNRWRELLNEFAQLEILEQQLSFREAVAVITQLAGETLYQPESEAGSLPVLGVLEAAGLEFDAIRVCGFDASRWPAASRPLPFVSRPLQRRYGMPDATVDDTLAFSRRVLSRLLGASRRVHFSWAVSRDGAEQQLTPLAAEIDCREAASPDPGYHASTLAGAAATGRPADDPVPPVQKDERISGGAYTVQRQVDDGFDAFAHGRLHVAELQPFQAGLSPGARGSILHRALHALYKDLPAQQEIRAWNMQHRDDLIRGAVQYATAGLLRYASPALTRIVALEQARMSSILQSYLEVEVARDAFTVHAVEEALVYNSHGVKLGLRVDRIDRLGSGEVAVIDYKTGREKTLLDRSGDIDDLQLVVYAIALDEKIGQLAIANLDSRGIEIRSTSGVADWDASFAAWSRRVDEAMRRIAAGDARVNIALNTDQGRRLNVLSRFEELRRE